jgi:hypothetical protein
MNIYLELSRPAGMVQRWEKVYERLLLLNRTYPLRDCGPKKHRPILQSDLQQQIVDEGIAEGAIFLTVRGLQKEMEPIVLMMSDKVAGLCSSLRELGLLETRFEAQGELLPARSEFRSEGTLVSVVFSTVACHAYIQAGSIRLASLDLLIQMYYALYFMELRNYVPVSILCTIQRLIDLEAKRRADPSIPLREAFPMACVGHQPTLPELKRAHRVRLLEYSKKKGRKTRKAIKSMKTHPVVTLTQ